MKAHTLLKTAGGMALLAVLFLPTRRATAPRGPLAEEPSMWIIDATPGAPRVGTGRAMPDKPFNAQQRPPCAFTQEELSGGCWYRLAQRPPCGPEQYQRGEGCFLPVYALPTQPVTGTP